MRARWLEIGLSILVSVAIPRAVWACAPLSAEAVFVHDRRPGPDLADFARGQLELLSPDLARSYLLVAWCHLSGRGLTPEEQRGARDYWFERTHAIDSGIQTSIEAWHSARALVPAAGPKPPIEPYRPGPDPYSSHLNCAPDAFFTAAATLRARVEAHGAEALEVREWVAAQDRVFAACAGPADLPAPARPDASAQARADRAYQVAAAHFYAGHHDEAVRGFREIASSDSSWREVASYLVARALARKAWSSAQAGGDQAAAVAAWKEAEIQLRALLTDPGRRRFHLPALRLLDEAEAALEAASGDDAGRHAELRRLNKILQALNDRQDTWSMKHLLLDFSWRMDALLEAEEGARDEQTLAAMREHDLTDWIVTLQLDGLAALEHALSRWQSGGAPHWLVAALSRIDGRHPGVNTLLEAAAKIPADSPAFPTVAYHRARLLIEAGRHDDARAMLQGQLEPATTGKTPGRRPPPVLSRSTLNQLLALRLRLAPDLDALLRDAPRVPAAIRLYGEVGPGYFDPKTAKESLESFPRSWQRQIQARSERPLWATDAADVLNERLPLTLLAEASRSRSLDPALREELALATFVRAVLLDRHDVARQLAVSLRQRLPALKGLLNDYLAARGLEAERFAAALLILKHPGMRPLVNPGLGRHTPLDRIDDYRDNWWWLCGSWPYQESIHFYKIRLHRENLKYLAEGIDVSALDLIPPVAPAPPAFLTPDQIDAAQREWAALEALGEGANVLARYVLGYTAKAPADPRLPEALHLAVRATRYSCGDEQTSRHSRQAFQELHRRYQTSPWAKKTPYWF